MSLFIQSEEQLLENFLRSRRIQAGQTLGYFHPAEALDFQFLPGIEPDRSFLHKLMHLYFGEDLDNNHAKMLLLEHVEVVDPVELLGMDIRSVTAKRAIKHAQDGLATLYLTRLGKEHRDADPVLLLKDAESGQLTEIQPDGKEQFASPCAVINALIDEWLEERPKGVKASAFVGEAARGGLNVLENMLREQYRSAVAVSDDVDVRETSIAERVIVLDGDAAFFYDDVTPFRAQKIKLVPHEHKEAKWRTNNIGAVLLEMVEKMRETHIAQVSIIPAHPHDVLGSMLGAFFSLEPHEVQQAMMDQVEATQKTYFVTERRLCPDPLPEGCREIKLL